METNAEFWGTLMVGGFLALFGLYLLAIARQRTRQKGYQPLHLAQDVVGTVLATDVERPFIGGIICFLIGILLAGSAFFPAR